MTNTNDFRRYSYGTDASYAINAFNVTRSSAAPKYTPEPKKDFRVRPYTKKKSRAELISDQRTALKKAVVIVLVTLLATSMLFGVLFTYVQKNELTHSIANLKSDIAVAQSENVSLNAELESMVSVSQIDIYAIEKLGMVRLQSNQIKYIDISKYKEERAQSLNSQSPENALADE